MVAKWTKKKRNIGRKGSCYHALHHDKTLTHVKVITYHFWGLGLKNYNCILQRIFFTNGGFSKIWHLTKFVTLRVYLAKIDEIETIKSPDWLKVWSYRGYNKYLSKITLLLLAKINDMSFIFLFYVIVVIRLPSSVLQWVSNNFLHFILFFIQNKWTFSS